MPLVENNNYSLSLGASQNSDELMENSLQLMKSEVGNPCDIIEESPFSQVAQQALNVFRVQEVYCLSNCGNSCCQCGAYLADLFLPYLSSNLEVSSNCNCFLACADIRNSIMQKAVSNYRCLKEYGDMLFILVT
ncbi:hypothetical protein L345_04831, partial [Ophiophagus hannah]